MEETMNSADPMTKTLRDVADMAWEVVVIGGGPAGSLAARQAALAGLNTLIVEAKQFPRVKVCGGYLNFRALNVMHATQLSEIVASNFDSTVHTFELVCHAKRARFPLPAGRVICRPTFDAALLDSARAVGAQVITGTQAAVDPIVRSEEHTSELKSLR